MTTRITRGIAALVTLLLLLLGIPAALLTIAGNPFPDTVSFDALQHALTTADTSGTTLLTVLVWVAWIAWASFVVAVLLELPAQLRGMHAPALPLPGFSVQQAGARALIGAVLAMVTIGGVAGTANATTLTPAANAAPAAAATQLPTHHGTHPATTKATHQTTHAKAGVDKKVTVKPGDTLWGISQRTLGHGQDWHKIYNASKDIRQPGGEHLTNPNQIGVNWTLNVPAAGSAHHAATHHHQQHQPPAEKAAPKPQPKAPAGHHATAHEHHTAPAPSAASKQPAQSAHPSSGTSSNAPGQANGEGTATRTPAASGALPTTNVATASEAPHHWVINRTTTGLAATAAAGLLVLLGARRAAQTRRRRPGRRIAMPETDTQTTETAIRNDADPLAAEHLDLALRSLAAACTARKQPVPDLRAARITSDKLELYLADSTTLPAPFTALTDGVWTIDRDGIPRLLDPEDAAAVPAPYPCLITLGQDEEAAWLLLNLEHAGALTLTGTNTDGALAGITIELIGSAWADDLRLTLVDAMPDLADALGSDRATYVTDLDHVLTSLEYAANVHAQALTEAGVESVTQARATGVLPDTWTPHLLVLGQDPDPEQLERIRSLLHRVPRLAVAALTTGTTTYSEWTLTLTEQDAILAPYDMRLIPQALSDAQYRQILDLFRVTEAEDVPGPVWAASIDTEPAFEELPAVDLDKSSANAPGDDTPTEPAAVSEDLTHEETTPAAEPTVDDAPAPAASSDNTSPVDDALDTLTGDPFLAPLPDRTGPLVRLLGPVEIQGATGKRPAAPGRSTELIAYLALHPGRDHEPLDNALWPSKPMTAGKRNGPVSAARAWLGTAPDGHPYVALVDEHGYRLADDAPVDWHEFQDLIGTDISTTSTDNLKRALQLVDGQPLTAAATSKGRAPRVLWSWCEVDRQEMIATIADVAHALAARAIRAGDARLAAWSAAKGTMVEPASEVLWRDALRAAYISAQPGRVEHVAADLTERLEAITGELEPETLELLDELLHPHRAAS